jgi:hypothetical protein
MFRFQSFVVGPIGTEGFGLIRRCVECGVPGTPQDASCGGFGCGCLTRAREEEKLRHGHTSGPVTRD